MTIDYTSKQSLADEGLNVNPISSVNTLDDNSLTLSGSSSANATTQGYSSTSGYGLVNAAAAVAKSIGQNTFADVPALGGNNWGADMIKAPEVWAKGYTGQGVVVAVVDTGVDYNHADLKDNIWTNPKEIPGNGIDDDGNGYIDDAHGWNFVNNTNQVMDDNSHGTHVSGIIAGEGNGLGVKGIAYGAKIMPVKVLDNSGAGSDSAIANGIYYAVNNGANVINLSLGGDLPDSTLESAIDYADKKGVFVVMAAGNNGYPFLSYPAAYANNSGIAVGAVDQNNNMADFSNRPGLSQLDYVTAPGVNIYSSIPGDQYAYYSGTSMATPYVTGVVALMLSANHNLTVDQIRQILTSTAGNSTQPLTSSSNTSSLLQVITNSVANSMQALTLSSNTSSWRQVITNSVANSMQALTPSSNTSSLPQIIAEMTGNSLQTPTASFKISSMSKDNTISTLESGSQFVNSNNISSLFPDYDSAVDNNSDSSLGDDDGIAWEKLLNIA